MFTIEHAGSCIGFPMMEDCEINDNCSLVLNCIRFDDLVFSVSILVKIPGSFMSGRVELYLHEFILH